MPFGFPSILQPKVVTYRPDRTITQVKVIVNSSMLSDPADFLWYVSADGGGTWEGVATNVWVTLSVPGSELLLQVVGNPGATLNLRSRFLEVQYR